MGYMFKWDISRLIERMETIKNNYAKDSSTTFITGGDKDTLFQDSDVEIVSPEHWQPHAEPINCVTFIHELRIISSCSFDRQVFMFNTDCKKVGQLLLGNRDWPAGTELTKEQQRFKDCWRIKIDKNTRFREEYK